MAEWLILSILVPALVASAVLLVGFPGCSFEHGHVAASPESLSATAKSSSVITLTWSFGDAEHPVDHFEVERTDPQPNVFTFETPSSSYDDNTGLTPATPYEYRVLGVYTNAGKSGWSDKASATTPGLNITQNDVFGSVDTKTVKCEIAASDLVAPSPLFAPVRMWITLGQWASVAGGEPITFSKVFIGHQAAGDPWDATSLTPVLFGGAASTVVAPGNTSRSDQIAFAWDGTSALILSMFFAGGPSSDALTAKTGTNSTTHLKDAFGIDEAATADAAGYTSFPGYLSGVIRIEVA